MTLVEQEYHVGEEGIHETNSDCWCEPTRERFNHTLGQWERLNRSTDSWEPFEDE